MFKRPGSSLSAPRPFYRRTIRTVNRVHEELEGHLIVLPQLPGITYHQINNIVEFFKDNPSGPAGYMAFSPGSVDVDDLPLALQPIVEMVKEAAEAAGGNVTRIFLRLQPGTGEMSSHADTRQYETTRVWVKAGEADGGGDVLFRLPTGVDHTLALEDGPAIYGMDRVGGGGLVWPGSDKPAKHGVPADARGGMMLSIVMDCTAGLPEMLYQLELRRSQLGCCMGCCTCASPPL